MLPVITTSRSIDYNDFRNTMKWVQLGILLATLLSNCTLILVFLCRHGCRSVLLRSKHAVQVSMAVAGVVSALFPNLVDTKMLFESKDHGIECTTVTVSDAYYYSFMPLCFGIGFFIIGIDLILELKTDVYDTSFFGRCRRVFPILCSLLPWIIAASVAFPLTILSMDMGHPSCPLKDVEQMDIAVICCYIVPVGLILITIAIVIIFVQPGRSYNVQEMFDSPIYSKDSSFGNKPKVTDSPSSSKNHQLFSVISISGESDTTLQSQSPLFQNQGRFKSKDKCVIIFSMIVCVMFILPFGAMFLEVTHNYNYMSLGPMGKVFMVDFKTFMTYRTCEALTHLCYILVPLIWLCDKY